MQEHMRQNTPPPIMNDDDDDIPIGEDDIEIIDDAEIEAIEGYDSPESLSDVVEDDEVALDCDLETYLTQDDSLAKFERHTESVYCCDINVTKTHAVSGGGDDKGYVWDVRTGELFFECTGYTDSVSFCSFNHDGSLVAVADMKGKIKVWRLETKSEIWDFDVSDLGWLKWHKGANILLAGVVSGEAWMWLVPSGPTKTFPSFGTPVLTGTLLKDGKRMLLGYDDGSLRLWDLKALSVIFEIGDHSNEEDLEIGLETSILSVASSYDDALLACGSASGTVKIIATNSGKVITKFEVGKASVESIAFSPKSSILAVCTNEGTIVIWDTTNKMERHKLKEISAVVKLIWHSDGNSIFAACYDRKVVLIDALTGEKKKTWRGHNSNILDMALSSDGEMFVTASDDDTCRVFSTV